MFHPRNRTHARDGRVSSRSPRSSSRTAALANRRVNYVCHGWPARSLLFPDHRANRIRRKTPSARERVTRDVPILRRHVPRASISSVTRGILPTFYRVIARAFTRALAGKKYGGHEHSAAFAANKLTVELATYTGDRGKRY